ncbi:MAG: NADH-quinone oxidoreductase subunit N [Fidelibacterota bacterium]
MDLSQTISSADFRGILPEIILLVTALVILTLEMLARPRRRIMPGTGIAGILLAGFAIWRSTGGERTLFGGMLTLNGYSTFFDVLYLAIGIASFLTVQRYLEWRGGEARGEYYGLILFSTIGMMLMTRANDLIIVFLGLELLSLSLYVLIGLLRHDAYSNEGGIKYLLLGAFTTGFFLFGTALIYGSTATTNFSRISLAVESGHILSQTLLSLGIGLVLIGFSFKVAIVPFHMWSPDVYQGAPTTITAFLSTGPKAAGFGALMKVFLVAFPVDHVAWQDLLWILAVLTMTVGNISALVQSNVKRMLAFSSVAHAGYLLIGVVVLDQSGVSAVLFYLSVYAAMNFGAFAVVSLVEKGERGLSFDDYRGLASRHPWLAAVLALFMISLAGFPPTAGFVAKYALFSAAVSHGYVWLVVFSVGNTLISITYYVRLIVSMTMEKEEAELPTFVKPHMAVLLAVLAAIILLFGINPSLILDGAVQAAKAFS